MDDAAPSYDSAVRKYHARVPYLSSLFTQLAEYLDLSRSTRLIDIACGPGNVALGFSAFVGECLLVDPSAEMLKAARAADYDPQCKTGFLKAPIEDLPSDLGTFSVATVGRALHWFEKRAAMASLERLLEPGSFAIILEAGTLGFSRNPWHRAFNEVRRRHASSGDSPKSSRPSEFFADSSFAAQRGFRVTADRWVSIDRLIERAESYSDTSPQELGNRAAEMEADLRAALAPYAQNGSVLEVTYSDAMVLQRSE